MELYFVRHAIAAERVKAGDDAARALTDDGAEKMRAGAAGLRRLGVAPDMLLSSPLVRARETADILAAALGVAVRVADLLGPGCDLAALTQVLTDTGAAQRVMLVGHEPDWSALIGVLTGGRVEMKKGAACRIDLPYVAASAGVLIWLTPPKTLRALA